MNKLDGPIKSARVVALGIVTVVAVLTLAGCSSNSASTNTTNTTVTTTTGATTRITALSPAAATSQVSAAFTTLFNADDSNVHAKLGLLQDASKYQAKFNALYASAEAKQNPTSAKVVSVTFPSTTACQASVQNPVCAKVVYDLDTATTGSSLLANQSGYAVYIDGKWLVSDDTFCVLAGLAGQKC
jgi:hypothetical protein